MTETSVIEQQSAAIDQARDAQRRLDMCVGAVVSARERLAQVDRASLLAGEEIQRVVAMAARTQANPREGLDRAADHAVKVAAAVEATVAVMVTRNILQTLGPLLPKGTDESSGSTLRSLSLFASAEEALAEAVQGVRSDDLDTAASAGDAAARAEGLGREAAQAALGEGEARARALEARVSKAEGSSGAGPGCLVALLFLVVIGPIAQLMNAPVLAFVPLVVWFVAAKMIKSARLESAKRARAAEVETRSRLMAFVAERERAQVRQRARA